MSDFRQMLAEIRRPRLLIRAARFGMTEYNRDRDLKRLLASDPKDPWPPSDLQQTEPPAPTPTEPAAPRPAYEPKPPSGLAWEGGSQSRTDVS